MSENRPWIAVDCVVFDRQGRLLLIKRKFPPFQDSYALPGGFVETGETTELAALRELKEETGMEARVRRLIGVYSNPARDPRHHTISVAYLLLPEDGVPVAGDDASDAEFIGGWESLSLAFDHALIVRDALRLKASAAD